MSAGESTESPASGPPASGPPGPGPSAPEAEGLATLGDLWAVQQVDSRLAGARARLAALDDGSALRAEAERARTKASEAAARLRETQAALRDHELQLATTERKQKKAEGDLYGGRISNPKELTSLQEDVASLSRARDHLEDQILSLLDQVEALKGGADELRRAAEGLDGRLTAHLAQYEEARNRLEAEIAALSAERAALAGRVEPRTLRKYEGIAAQEGGVGMVAIVGGFCGGCRNDVPPQFVSRIREGRIVTCERCHRILYLNSAQG
jgi:predicted  nucleic acid-binding Zn-ribbon protein